MKGLWRFFKRYHSLLAAIAIFALITARQFKPELVFSEKTPLGWRTGALLLLAIYLLACIAVFLNNRRPASSSPSPRKADLETSLLILAAANLLIQIGGTYGAYIYPLNYLVLAMFVVYFGVKTALLFALFLPALEIIERLIARATGENLFATPAGHAVMGLLFVAIVGAFLRQERHVRDRALDKLDRLTTDADSLALPRREPAVMREAVHQTAVNHTRDLDKELADLMDIARMGLAADACVTLFADPHGVVLHVRAMSGDPSELDEEAVIPIEGSIPGLVFRQSDPQVLKKIDRNRQPFEYRRGRAAIRSSIAQPLLAGDRAIGVIMADSKREDAFGSECEEFFRKIAVRVAEAYRLAQNVAGIDRERGEFAAYYDVVKTFSQTLTLEQAMRIAFDVSLAILPYDGAAITYYDPLTKRSQIAGVYKFPEKWIGLDWAENESLSCWVCRTQKPLAYSRLPEMRKPLYHPDCKLRGVRSLLALPLTVHDRCLGTLAFFWESENAFTPYDQKLLEVIAVHAATSLDSARMYKQMEQLATTDGLTGLPNHRTFQSRLDEELARYKRIAMPVALILMDIDFFKKINDAFGHPVGDQVLREISLVLAASVRNIDMAARYGGEEFALVLPNTTQAGAYKFAERLRKQISGIKVRIPGEEFRVTVSLGFAVYPDDAADKTALIEAADRALYRSKEDGRNRTSAAGVM